MAIDTTLATLHAAFVNTLEGVFSQRGRLLRLQVADGGWQTAGLLAFRVRGEEAVSAEYCLTVDALSADGDLELKRLLGRVAEVSLLLPDGRERSVSGLISAAAQTGSDGGFARYCLRLVPGLALLAHRRNSRVFQDLSVPQIVDTLLAEHRAQGGPWAAACRWENRLSKDYAPRSTCLQYRESDLAFLRRLLAEEGIATRYEFAAGESLDAPPTHTLVLFDDAFEPPACPQPLVRFHRADETEEDDTLTVWHAARRLRAGQSALASFDYKPVAPLAAAEASRTEQGEAGTAVESLLTDYDPQTAYYGSDTDDLARYASLRQAARDREAKDYAGESSVRALGAGQWFELIGHPRHDGLARDATRFLVRELVWEAENNLPGELATPLASLLGRPASEGKGLPPYRNRFLAVRRDTPVAPAWPAAAAGTLLLATGAQAGLPWTAKATAPGVQTATVVGPAGEEIHTDAFGRIKIQFHWVRETDHPDGGAALDDRSSAWVRVATPWAGDGWGQQHLPRIGQEVLVSFIEGDIDRPVVLGSLFNGSHPTPAFGGAGSLPANRALAGIRSKEVKGAGSNQLLFDDSTGQVRTQLASSHGASELNLGYLIQPRREGKGEPRGEGFELRTDQSGALRAGQGLFLSAEARSNASGNQLDRREAQAQLNAALEQVSAQSRTAQRQNADTVETGAQQRDSDGEPKRQGHQQHLVDALTSWEEGSNTANQDASTSEPEAGGQSMLVASAPAGIALTTPQAMTLVSNSNRDLVSGRDSTESTARRWVHNVGRSISFFIQGLREQAAFKLFAAQGNVKIQAQGGKVEFAARGQVAVTAATKDVTAVAGKSFAAMAGGGFFKLESGTLSVRCPGTLSIRASKLDLGGPASNIQRPPDIPTPAPRFDEQFQLLDEASGEPLPCHPYRLVDESGNVLASGVTDDKGNTVRVGGPRAQKIRLLLGL